MGSGSSATERGRGRKRDSDASRAALLGAARDLFGRRGYDAVTLRDIGERAGVDASLIARYFGNKAALYRSAVDEDSREVTVSPERFDLGTFTATALHRADRRGAPGPLVQALLSQSNTPEVRAAAAAEMHARLVSPLADRLAAEGAEDPVGRAEVLISCLVGVIALRSSGLFDELSAMTPEAIGAILETATHSGQERTPHASDSSIEKL
ncbi:TetR/AcrR family transcriptional regulator [Streptomyces sp. NBC_00365]|uniref:TetR/AcrR family transcriptional regulator n=1 Tax=Streptomyces sp. NBC_00365 TaxID=2975726 RepID=UPI002253CB72|nr:TetR/AcrR family transcriptional regulator [Streptomyces sp. NBC_00365]MCX5095894.1 TetR/AcrR family transcriptional regulator [Streptomyces sp. NBC_00365]